MISSKEIPLRDYQKEIVTHVQREWEQHRSIMVQMPTGTGKTYVLASIVSAFSGKVLIVAHRVELIEQIRETVDTFTNREVKVESIQTVARRIETLPYEPELVIIDEAHHALAKTYRLLWEKWPKAKFLGLTATPCRMNRNGFTDLFDTLVTSWNMADFIRKEVLSAFDYVSIRPGSREQQLIDSLQKRGADGDFQIKEMDTVLNKRPSIDRLYRSIERFAKGKKGIVYAISIDHARRIAEYYQRKGTRTEVIDSRTPKEERKRLVRDFKDGNIQVLVNVDVFSEGFDCPDVEFVQMARPTLSLAKYLQQVGRGLRKSKGKECCMLIDNVGLYQLFGLPIQAWNWEQMFRGAIAGKGERKVLTRSERVYSPSIQAEMPKQEPGLRLVIAHDMLLDKLEELSLVPAHEGKTAELKAWKEKETGLWGLRRGKDKTTEASYITVFDIKDNLAAVRLSNHECGLVNDTGKVLWKQKGGISMKMDRNRFLTIEMEGNKEIYVDLYNLKTYPLKPEIRRYGNFELLKVKHTCFSRTQRQYSSRIDFEGLLISNKGFLLSILESAGNTFCILKGDTSDYYRIHCWLADGSVVIEDPEGKHYHATEKGEKEPLDPKEMIRLEERIKHEMKTKADKKRTKIQNEYKNAIPYQSGMRWGLKVGERITVPPIYRKIKPPVGIYCAVEKNYSQWGVITIDGSILVEPQYPDVSIKNNGTALLTLVTGKKITIKL